MCRKIKVRMTKYGVMAFVLIVFIHGASVFGATLKVPSDYKTIPQAIEAATEGDTILIAQGTYIVDALNISKELELTSNYTTSGNAEDIDKTIIKASKKAGKAWFKVGLEGTDSKILGLTIVGNKLHTMAIENKYTEVSHCKFIGGKDQLSFENGGGLISYCHFEKAGDEPIDADRSVDWIIEYCTFKNSGDDGIEIRLHPKGGAVTTHIIRYNTFLSTKASSVQLIDYKGDSKRRFEIYGNTFQNAGTMGLDCTLHTKNRNRNGSPMLEKVVIYNNTFDNCQDGITMAPDVIVLNNIFLNIKDTGIIQGKYAKPGDGSMVDYCLFFNNKKDYEEGVNIGKKIFKFNPKYSKDASYVLLSDSEAIDKGTSSYTHQGENVLEISDTRYTGKSPDLGANEHKSE